MSEEAPVIDDDDIEPEPIYDFKFDRIGAYGWTTVSITATIPFRRLHLLLALPALILRAYWQALKTPQHAKPCTKLEQLERVQDLFNQEKEAMDNIQSLTHNVDLSNSGFPGVTIFKFPLVK